MAALLTSVVLAIGACGNGEGQGRTVASVAPQAGSTSSAAQAATGKDDPLAYAKCMRQNGLPDFPDPKPEQGLGFTQGGPIDPTSPQFKKAESQCKQFMGSSQQKVAPQNPWSPEDQLKYAQCMRENGVPKFPDPKADGSMPPLIKGGDVDPMSPQFKKADAACAQYQPQNMPKRNPGSGS
ncbi:hypothetical protein [Microtetraspora malaysiensis]|uniref:hypothetical protein n=1 Tax=Microtetraspora malaysiensis TaxID=161358 RepID=UPI003D8B394F